MSLSVSPIFDLAYASASRVQGMQPSRDLLRRRKDRIGYKERPLVIFRAYVVRFLRVADPNKFSYPVICRFLGLKDHTSAIYLDRKAKRDGWNQGWTDSLFEREVSTAMRKCPQMNRTLVVMPNGCTTETIYANAAMIDELGMTRLYEARWSAARASA